MLKRFVVVLAGLGFMSACGGGGAGGAVKLASETADKICACADMACAQAAMEDYAKKAAEMMKTVKPEDVKAEDMQKVKEATDKWMKCQTDLTTKAAGGAGAEGGGGEGK